MSTKFGDAYITLNLDDSPFLKGMYGLKGKLDPAIARVTAGITAAFDIANQVGGHLNQAVSEFTDFTGKVTDLGARTGLSAEALTSLGFAADQTGASMESVANATLKMKKAIFEAGQGSKKLAGLFNVLGVDIQAIQDASPEVQFQKLAEAIARIPDSGQQAAAAMQIFGKGAVDLLPLLKSGEEGIAAFRAEADRLGITLSKDVVDAGDNLGDAIDRLTAKWRAMKNEAVAAIAPILEVGADAATSTLSGWNRLVATMQDAGALAGPHLYNIGETKLNRTDFANTIGDLLSKESAFAYGARPADARDLSQEQVANILKSTSQRSDQQMQEQTQILSGILKELKKLEPPGVEFE